MAKVISNRHLCKSFFITGALFLFLPLQQKLHARTVTLPVNGLEVAALQAVPMELDWDENFFADSKTSEYNHQIARIAAFLSEISYVLVEKSPDNNEMLSSYQALGFDTDKIEWNYFLDYSIPLIENNQAAFSLARKDINTKNGNKTLIFVVLRGTPLSANEWISNLNISDTTHKEVQIHEGFSKTTQNIKQALCDYLEENGIDKENSIFLLTGHSRGGALANLLGATLIDEKILKSEQLFVYTFASPNVSQMTDTDAPRYDCIWNIVNAEDLVASVPPNRNKWKWKKYGHTKVLVNYWNTDPETYTNNYIPRMNKFYNKLLLRDYAPFKTGPFLQIQTARVLTKLYKNTEQYYNSVYGLRNMAENIFWQIFPENQDEAIKKEKKAPFLLRAIQNNINSNVEGGFDYALKAFIDMHACESYLCWLLALDEKEAFSELGNTQITIDGSYDCAITDEQGQVLARVKDSSPELYKLKMPVAVFPLPHENIFGFPGHSDFLVTLYKGSLFPTPLTYKIEHYSASGQLLETSKKAHFYPRSNHVIQFLAGKSTLTEKKVTAQVKNCKSSKPIIKAYKLNKSLQFKIQPEFSFTPGKSFFLGFRTGTQAIYFSVLGELYTPKSSNYFGFASGIGHQHSLCGRLMLDTEFFNHFIWVASDTYLTKFNIVPAARFSISYQPRHRVHFFGAAVFDLHLEKINDAAFTSELRKKTFPPISISDKAELLPAIQFGIRL